MDNDIEKLNNEEMDELIEKIIALDDVYFESDEKSKEKEFKEYIEEIDKEFDSNKQENEDDEQ